jgi:glutathione synthase
MKRKILFVIDKLELKYFESNKLVTNFWLIEEFLQRNFKVFITTIDKLMLKNAKAYCACTSAYTNNNIFLEEHFISCEIEDFDLVMFRPDPPVDLDYINATYILDFVDKEKTLILNDTKAIRDFNEKLHANIFNEFMPENIVTSNQEEIENFLEKHNEIILKPLNNCFGTGVMYLQKGDKNIKSIINALTNNQSTLIMVQKYISNAQFGDKRVLILGEEVLEECVIKLPSKNDFKFNTHSDEFIKKALLTDSEKFKFKQIAKKLNSMGIFMAGLDVIDEQIIEVNVTSPCYFIKEINNYFSIKLEKKIVDYILKILADKNTKLFQSHQKSFL